MTILRGSLGAMSTFNVAQEFTETPGGRYRAQGKWSGEELREDHLIPLLARSKAPVEIQLDGLFAGLPPSFAEEAFGGLARKLGPSVLGRVTFSGWGAEEAAGLLERAADQESDTRG